MTRPVRSWVFALAVCIAHANAAPGLSDVYRYQVSWNGIPAALATIALTNDPLPEAAITHVAAEIRTNRFVDLFWSLRASASADVDAVTLRSQRFVFERRVRGQPERTDIETEPDGTLTGRYARPGRYRLIEVSDPKALDPIAAILQARRDLPDDGRPIAYDIFTGEGRFRIALRRTGSEEIRVGAGRFAAVRIEPTICKIESGTNKPDDRVRHLTLWVTEASPHIPLRVRSEVFIGAVYCDLVDIARK